MNIVENSKTVDLDALRLELEDKYGGVTAQQIIDHLTRFHRPAKVPDYMDVKAMSELQERFRAQAVLAVWRLRDWRKRHGGREPEQNLVLMEGAFLQRQCQDAIRLYREAHQAYYAMYRAAMAALTNRAADAYQQEQAA